MFKANIVSGWVLNDGLDEEDETDDQEPCFEARDMNDQSSNMQPISDASAEIEGVHNVTQFF